MTLRHLRTSVEGITAEAVEIAGKLEFEVVPKDVTELLQSHDKTALDEKLLFKTQQSGFLGWTDSW